MKRLPWFEFLLILVVMSMGVYAALSDAQNLSWNWFTRDDAYYYFKVAQNISEGRGSTFDGINPTNGYHPLWMLICVPIFALARFDLILPLRVLLLVMSGLSVATAIVLYRLIGRIFVPAVGAAVALFWVFSHDVLITLYQNGLESGIAAFFIVLLVYQLYELERSWRERGVSKKQIAILAVIAVLVMFSRLDLVFLAGLAGIWIIFRGSPLRFLLPLDIASVVILTLLAFILRVGITGYYNDVNVALAMIGSSLLVKIPIAYVLGLYQRTVLHRRWELLKRLVVFAVIGPTVTGGLMLLLLYLGVVQGSFSRLIIGYDVALTLVFFGWSRLVFASLRTEWSLSSEEERKPLPYLQRHTGRWLREGAIYYGIVLGALGLFMAWNRIVFGTVSPVSGQIKQWWASLPGRAYGGSSRDLLSFFGLSYLTDENAWRPVSSFLGGWAERLYQVMPIRDTWRYLILLGLFAIVFYAILLLRRRKSKTASTQMSLVPLLGAAWLQMMYYSMLGYAAHKEWYWVTQLVITALTFGLILGIVYSLIRKLTFAPVLAWALAAYVGVSMGAAFWRDVRASMPYDHWDPAAAYMDIVPLLEEHTEPGSIIGLTGGGNVGYFIQDRTIVNMDGLINSYPYFKALQAHEGGEYLSSLGMDYVLANPVILDQQPYKGQFNEYMEPTDIFYGGKQLMQYRPPE